MNKIVFIFCCCILIIPMVLISVYSQSISYTNLNELIMLMALNLFYYLSVFCVVIIAYKKYWGKNEN